ncbi:aminoacyl-histidine dipeptidase [Bacillus badius]|uniref:aminoacyl-histidine dipeptidase n=1 Tax=Bacillus badius TaxID=1455 RepID=UPI00059743B9|nr:aminoacyl-histidine dipeptidase [Bacillus badius]KIL74758.1 Aminoacyl-histidine dipeptidase (Peptidase D) [Bacillus badius]
MYKNIEELTQYSVFYYFLEVSNIPRCSGKEQKISNYLVDFARNHGLEVIQDQAMNVIIKKPATFGYEYAPTVIIHGNMDMVCEKNRKTIHDFEKDPLTLRIEGDMLYATDTTLGADSGVALAYALALLASERIPHPNLEVMITTEEKTTMNGARQIDPTLLNGSVLISIDAEEEGKFLVSSAGGVIGQYKIPILFEKPKKEMAAFQIGIGGLKGGHSGVCIDKGRGNANKLLGRVLRDFSAQFDYCIEEISGGTKVNAIPREAEATILVDTRSFEELESNIRKWNELLQIELKSSDPGVYVTCQRVEQKFTKMFSKETTEKVIAALTLMPNNVQSLSMDFPGLVESSSSLGVIITTNKTIIFESEIRSSVYSLQVEIVNQMRMLANVLNCEVAFHSEYPAWSYSPSSQIRHLCEKVYKEKYNKVAEVISTHAGIECGILVKKMDVDAICIGPDIHNIHTPSEHISISSTLRTWEYLLSILKEMNTM